MSITSVIQKLQTTKVPPIAASDYLEALIQSGEIQLPSEGAALPSEFASLELAISEENPEVGAAIAKLSLAEKQRLFLLNSLKTLYAPVPTKLSDLELFKLQDTEKKDAAFIHNEFIGRTNKTLLTYMLLLVNNSNSSGLTARFTEAYEMNLSQRELRKELEKSTRTPAESEAMEQHLAEELAGFSQKYNPEVIREPMQKAIEKIQQTVNEGKGITALLRKLDEELRSKTRLKEEDEAKILSEYQSKIYQALNNTIQETKAEFADIPPEAMHYMLEYLINDYHKLTKQHFDAEIFYRQNKNVDDNVINKLLLRQGADARPFGLDRQDPRFNQLLLLALAKGDKGGIGETLFYEEKRLRHSELVKTGLISKMDGIGPELAKMVSPVLGPPDQPTCPLDADSIKELAKLYTIGQKAYNEENSAAISCWKEIEPGSRGSKNELKPLVWKALLTLSPNVTASDKFEAYLELIRAYLPPRSVISMSMKPQDSFLYPLSCITQAQYLLNHEIADIKDRFKKQFQLEQDAIKLVHNAIHAPIPTEDKHKLLEEIQALLAAVQPLATVKTDQPNVYTFLYNDVTAAFEKEDKKKELAHLQVIIGKASDPDEVTLEKQKEEKLAAELKNPVQPIDIAKWSCCERGNVPIGDATFALVKSMIEYGTTLAMSKDLPLPEQALHYWNSAIEAAKANAKDLSDVQITQIEKMLKQIQITVLMSEQSAQQILDEKLAELKSAQKPAAQPATDIDVGVATEDEVEHNAPTKTTLGDQDMPATQLDEAKKLFAKILSQAEFFKQYTPAFNEHLLTVYRAIAVQDETAFAHVFGRTFSELMQEGALPAFAEWFPKDDTDLNYKRTALRWLFENSPNSDVREAINHDCPAPAEVDPVSSVDAGPVVVESEIDTPAIDPKVTEFKRLMLENIFSDNLQKFYAKSTPAFKGFIPAIKKAISEVTTTDDVASLMGTPFTYLMDPENLPTYAPLMAEGTYQFETLDWLFNGETPFKEAYAALQQDQAAFAASQAPTIVQQPQHTPPQQPADTAPKPAAEELARQQAELKVQEEARQAEERAKQEAAQKQAWMYPEIDEKEVEEHEAYKSASDKLLDIMEQHHYLVTEPATTHFQKVYNEKISKIFTLSGDAKKTFKKVSFAEIFEALDTAQKLLSKATGDFPTQLGIFRDLFIHDPEIVEAIDRDLKVLNAPEEVVPQSGASAPVARVARGLAGYTQFFADDPLPRPVTPDPLPGQTEQPAPAQQPSTAATDGVRISAPPSGQQPQSVGSQSDPHPTKAAGTKMSDALKKQLSDELDAYIASRGTVTISDAGVATFTPTARFSFFREKEVTCKKVNLALELKKAINLDITVEALQAKLAAAHQEDKTFQDERKKIHWPTTHSHFDGTLEKLDGLLKNPPPAPRSGTV